MALVKATLKSGIQALLADMRTRENVSDSDFAEELATLIDDYIKSAKVTVSGIVTIGSSTTQTQTTPVDAVIS